MPSGHIIDNRPSKAAWVVLACVCILSLFNYLDRMLLAAVIPLIKQEFTLSDTYIGMLSASFAILYAVGGVPLGRLADHYSRRLIIASSAVVWSLMTALCGLSNTYWSLFTARIGVSLGEAGYMSASYSMLSDYFTPARRNFAVGAQISFASLGIVAGLSAGGWLASAYGWRMAFVMLGAPGLLVALICYLAMREPQRGAMDSAAAASEPPPSVINGLAILARNPIFVWLAICGGFNAFCAIGMVQWLPSFFVRTHEMPLATIGVLFGSAFGLGLGMGQVFGGIIASRMARRGTFEPLKLCIWSNLALAPAYLIVLWLPNANVAIATTFIATFIGALSHGSQGAGVQNTLPVRLRGMGHGVYAFSVSALGMAVGPLLVGVMSDAFAKTTNEADALRYALSVGQLMFIAAAFCGWRSWRAGKLADVTIE